MRWLFANPVLGLRPCIYGEWLSQVERSPTYPSQLFIHFLITRGEPFYCTFHKYANSKVQKTPSQLRFSLPSIIITIISNEPWNTETHKTDRNPPITDHKPWPFEPVKVKFCFLRGALRWLTAAKNAIVSWLSNFRIRMFVKSAVMTKKKVGPARRVTLLAGPAWSKRNNREFKLHVYGKRQTSDSSQEFLKIENEPIKTLI